MGIVYYMNPAETRQPRGNAMHMDRRKISLFPILLAMAGLVFVGLMLYAAFADREYGHMDVSVVDAYTLEPLEGALLVFPDSGHSAKTDTLGRAQVFGLPIHKHREQNKILPQPYGECTLLAYREGYIPYALFYVQLQPGRIRSGPTIYLFPDYEGAPAAITIVESPTYDWAKGLVEKYKP